MQQLTFGKREKDTITKINEQVTGTVQVETKQAIYKCDENIVSTRIFH